VNPFKKFTISHVSKKLNEINFKISLSHKKPFPNLNFLSNYRFKKRFVKILPNGDIQIIVSKKDLLKSCPTATFRVDTQK
jgi:hypothetical protein